MTSNALLSEQERNAYEAYILSNTNEERQEAIKKLIPGSHLYYHLYFLDRLKQVGSKLTEQDTEMLNAFRQRYGTFQSCQELVEIDARLKLHKYDEAQTDEERAQILLQLTRENLVNVTFDYQKPEYLKKTDESQSSSQSEDDESMQDLSSLHQFNFGALQPPKKSSKFEYERLFSKDQIQAQYRGVMANNIDYGLLVNIPFGREHAVQYMTFDPDTLWQWINQNVYRLSDVHSDDFYQAFARALTRFYSLSIYNKVNAELMDLLTIQHLDKLATLVPQLKDDNNFIGSYFQKSFHEELSKENQAIWSTEEKRENLLTLYKYAKNKSMPQSLRTSLLIEILELGVKLGQYDEVLFEEYLQNPMALANGVQKSASRYQYGDNHWNKYIGNVQSKQNNEGRWTETNNSIVNTYLEYFCFQKGSLQAYKTHIEEHHLQSIEEKVSIYKSDDMTDLKIDLRKYQSISSEVVLRFLESNQDQFKVEEEVQLSLEIKNVQTIFVKIFEFNTETYYKKTLQPFNTGVNLDGLIASIEKSEELKYPPNKKIVQKYTFPELSGKIGLFIVEFIGNGLSARAIIKKGSLSMIHKPSIAGTIAYVLDENKLICSGPKTGIFFDDQYYPSSEDKGGKIFIPYGSQKLDKAILINNGFAQLCDFQRLGESYIFSAWIHLNQESLLTGNNATVLIKPSLRINNIRASLDVLKNTKITLTSQNYIDNIPVTKTFEKVKFSNNAEYLLDFQVPPYLSSVKVVIETEVYCISTQSTSSLSAQQEFTVETHQSSLGMNELYLRKEKGTYNLYLLGKNGEPNRGVSVSVKFVHTKATSNHTYEQILTTDTQGRIQLGVLKQINAITATVTLYNLNKTFFLNQFTENLTYPCSIDAIENEDIEFPVLFNKKKRTTVSLIRLSDDIILEDLYEKVEFVKNENKEYNLISLKGLIDGQYLLNIKDVRKIIQITVHKGQPWQGNSFVLKKNCLFENNAPLKMVKISNVQVEENKQGTKDIIIKLDDFSKDTRVHIIGNQFETSDAIFGFYRIVESLQESINKTVFPFAQWKNIFMSNRELSDEFRYVFDRKYAERFQGNTLERPRLLLKRTFLQTTQTDQEMLRAGTQFQQQSIPADIQYFAQNIAPAAYSQSFQPVQQHYQQQQVQSTSKSSYSMNHGSDPSNGASLYTKFYNNAGIYFYDTMVNKSKIIVQSYHKSNEFQNFLKTQPLQILNLKPNSDGLVQISANLINFTQLHILVLDNLSVAKKQINLDVNPIQKRDLSLKQTLDAEKGFTESRTTLIVQKSDTHQIEDINSTEIQMIDDLMKVKGVLEELIKSNGTNSTGVYKEFIDDVMKWHSYSEEEKSKQYSKNHSHEFNIFLNQKDPDFFKAIVKPFLSHKMEKTFVDHYLLENYTKLAEYIQIHKLNSLNSLEQCFLVDALVKLGKDIEAQRILKVLKMHQDSQPMRSTEQLNQIFDIVLNLNILKINPALIRPIAAPLNIDDLFGFIADDAPSAQATNNNFDPFGINMNNLLGAGGFGFGQAPPQIHPMNAPNVFMNQPNQQQLQQQMQVFNNLAQNQFGGGAMNLAINIPPQMRQQFMRNPGALMGNIAPQSVTTSSANVLMDFYGGYGDFNNVQPETNLFGGAYDQMEQYQEQKKKVRINFEEVQSTGEYIETHYFNQKNISNQAHHVTINQFWVDYAEYLLKPSETRGKFLSSNFINNASNQVSSLLTFAILDLPFEPVNHSYKTNEGRGLDIQASGDIIIFQKEVREAKLELSSDILVTHRYVNASDTSSISAAMPEEFLVNKAYQCEVIMTNVSPQPKNFSVLYQIPAGSLPLQMTKYMKSLPQQLSPYTTLKTIFYFYFPQEGQFNHFPSNIAEESKIVSRAAQHQIKVVRALSINKKETFRDVVMTGNKEDIYEFLRTTNLEKRDRGYNEIEILWMLKDKSFFIEVVRILRDKVVFSAQIWAFGIYHNDEESSQEFLQQYSSKLSHLFKPRSIQSKLLNLDQESLQIMHLDYYPMINARAHSVSDVKAWQLNKNFKTSYDKLLKHLIGEKSLNLAQKMQLVYCLQLQDRINEAIQLFRSLEQNLITDQDLTLKIQYDYMNAYFDFFTGKSESFKIARAIVRKYEDYPIQQWKMLFLEILDQLNEYDGEDEEPMEIEGDILTEEQKRQKIKQQINKEPRIDCDVVMDKAVIQLEIANIKQIVVKFYVIDAEILFSRTPFVKEKTEEFSYVKPQHVIEKDIISADLNTSMESLSIQQSQKFSIDIPEELKNQNMVIEVNGANKQIFKTYYASQIKVNIVETYGELKVTDMQGIALSSIYVKVFAQKRNGNTSDPFFFKDGYTDIRGKFEYAQSSGNRLQEVQKFAIFVMSDTLGSIIKECDPPKINGGMTASSEGVSQQCQMKQERIVNKIANWKNKKSNLA